MASVLFNQRVCAGGTWRPSPKGRKGASCSKNPPPFPFHFSVNVIYRYLSPSSRPCVLLWGLFRNITVFGTQKGDRPGYRDELPLHGPPGFSRSHPVFCQCHAKAGSAVKLSGSSP
eukprot:2333516-Rhodomonas_salina.2